MSAQPRPYGCWPSPIAASDVARASRRLGEPHLEGGSVYWVERRPDDGGRSVVVELRDGRTWDRTPEGFDSRSRIHEYGGGAFTVHSGVVYSSNFADGRLYCFAEGQQPEALSGAAAAAFGDLVVDHGRNRLLAVRESPTDEGEPSAAIVALALEGRDQEPEVLVSGDDFYSNPRLSPNGRVLVWLSWQHPDMPWDGTQLYATVLDSSGRPGQTVHIAGGPDESIFQPELGTDGSIFFVSDRSGWWNLERWHQDTGRRPLAPRAAEFGLPQWVFGMSTYALLDDRHLLVGYTRDGLWFVGVLELRSGRIETIDSDLTVVQGMASNAGRGIVLAASPSRSPHLLRLDRYRKCLELLHDPAATAVDESCLSVGEPIHFTTADGTTAHAFHYPPTNATWVGLDGESPPLLVKSHGGPTAATDNAYDPAVQFWTSRGFAVVDVNYRGSTGYGRAYREALEGKWGIADVEDCIAAAEALAERGLADLERLLIRGGSAGGYTTLCALTFSDSFRAGASYYGVGDLAALTHDTHKFESRYLDRLVGPYPEFADLYRERSPLFHAGRIDCPVVFFQGSEDRVVPPNQAEVMVAALADRNIPVQLHLYQGEGHGFRQAENIVDSLEAELAFYREVLGLQEQIGELAGEL